MKKHLLPLCVTLFLIFAGEMTAGCDKLDDKYKSEKTVTLTIASVSYTHLDVYKRQAYKRYAWEEAEHASKFAELIGEVVWDTKTNLEKRMNAECGACEDKMRLARMAKEQNLDAVHDTVHEMAKDEARHGKGFEGLYKRYFGK